MHESDAMVRARIRGHLWTWMVAVGVQAKRVLGPADDDQPEAGAYLFVLALRQVLRCVEWAIKNADAHHDGSRSKELRHALNGFDTTVPRATDVRDILSHFDEYDQGKGRLQKNGQPELLMMYSLDGVNFELILMQGYSIDVSAACDAAANLTERILASLEGPSR